MSVAQAAIATVDLSSVDLTDLDRWWSDGPPYELFARMRAEAPVRWNPTADGPGFWSLTRGAEIKAVSADPHTFSSAAGGIFLSPEALGPLEVTRNFPIFKDPPEHDLYRGIVAKAFLPRTMVLIDESIRAAVSSALDQVLAAGDTGECDLVRDIAVPVPVLVIGKMLGAADDDMEKLLRWTEDIEQGMTYFRDVTPTFREMAGHFMALVNNQLIRGVDSLAKSISEAEIDGRHLTEEEIAVYFGMLLYAGNEPSRSAISAGLLTLIQHPDQMELLRTSPPLLRTTKAGLAPAALAEILRWTTPVCYFARTATRDVVLGGVKIKAGDRVAMWYPSANRDPDMIAEPDTFDVTRSVNDINHCTYGGGGQHHCQGAFLSNKILSITLHETIKRLGDLEVSGPVTRVTSTFANSLTSLPVRFRPAVEPRPAIAQPRAYAPVAVPESPTPAAAAGPAAASAGAKPGLLKRLFGGK